MTDPVEAAVEEVAVLDKLSKGVASKLKEIGSFTSSSLISGDVDVGLRNMRHEIRKGYEELAHHIYGRTWLGRVTDEEDHFKQNFVFRLT